ncbi:MAG: ComF family protein [Aestuariivirga sp.]
MGLWRRLADAIAPPRCVACNADVGEPASLCSSCWQALRLIEPPCCPVLGTPFPYDQGEGTMSPAALAAPPAWDAARAAVAYDGVARRIVQAFKYRDRAEAGELMARMTARAGLDLLREADVIVPVPLHRLRLWQRRFNQAALLAQRLAASAQRPYSPQLLTRTRRTRQQVGLDHEGRRKNMRNAFRVPEAAMPEIAGRRVALVDDVRTTGATAEACAKALKAAGASHVSVLTFALVLEPHHLHI